MSTKTEVSPNVHAALDLIAALEPGERREMHHVSWNDYEELLNELDSKNAVRISYAEGTLELMAPLLKHERHKDILRSIVEFATLQAGINCEPAGSTTFKRPDLLRGAEPDTCFYIQHADVLIGKDDIDLSTDPPPDLVVEVDITSPSKRKLGIYARLGVPELWIWTGAQLHIYELGRGSYAERPNSIALPFLSAETLTSFVEQRITEGHKRTVIAFQEWLRIHQPAAQ
ncbi:MAG: Uma2 family endonuclease [Pyrinomonadaceae bacterium]|nr:Uma2 family endonuclease [Pyrinomonadaceae bacterium]